MVQRNAVPVYSGKNVIDIDTADDDDLAVGTDKVTIRLRPDRVFVSEDSPPAPADVAAEDLAKLYLHVNADGVIQSISYILDVDPHIFNLTSEEYTPVSQEYRGFRRAGNYGYLVPQHNIVIMEHTTDAIALLNVQFEQGVTEPFDYTGFGGGLTLYRRLKSSTGDWSHHNLVRDNSDHYNFQGGTGGGFFGSNNRYDVILRTGQAGDGTSATVPASNRLEPYPGGIKREYFPTFDQIDSITRLFDIVRDTVDGLTLDVTADVLTVTILRSAGQSLQATVTLPVTAELTRAQVENATSQAFDICIRRSTLSQAVAANGVVDTAGQIDSVDGYRCALSLTADGAGASAWEAGGMWRRRVTLGTADPEACRHHRRCRAIRRTASLRRPRGTVALMR